MPLVLPNSNDLAEYIAGPTDKQNIQQAMDLFVMATGLSDTSSSLEERIVHSAILEMAWALSSRHEDREAEFSAFTSERIGSYSYNKAAKAISEGQATGVPNFDAAVAYFLSQALSGEASVSSENVFVQDGNYSLSTGYDDTVFNVTFVEVKEGYDQAPPDVMIL